MGAYYPLQYIEVKFIFLFSREYIGSKDDGGLWSDFGGSKEKNESFFDKQQLGLRGIRRIPR